MLIPELVSKWMVILVTPDYKLIFTGDLTFFIITTFITTAFKVAINCCVFWNTRNVAILVKTLTAVTFAYFLKE